MGGLRKDGGGGRDGEGRGKGDDGLRVIDMELVRVDPDDGTCDRSGLISTEKGGTEKNPKHTIALMHLPDRPHVPAPPHHVVVEFVPQTHRREP